MRRGYFRELGRCFLFTKILMKIERIKGHAEEQKRITLNYGGKDKLR